MAPTCPLPAGLNPRHRTALLPAVVYLGCAVLLGLAAVGGAAAADEHVTLRFVSWKPDHPQVWDEALARFTREHPTISVVREIAPHSSTAYHDLLTQKLKNRDATVDLFFMDVIWVPEFAAAGWARPLGDRFRPKEQRRFLPATIKAGTYGGRIYGIPSRIDGGMLYYRKDLLQAYGFAPPRTWPELVRQAEVIVAKESATTPALRGYSGQFKQYEGLVCNMLEFIESNGGRLVGEEGARASLASPASLQAVQFVRERIIGRIASRALLMYQEPESLATFIQGHAVFHRNWPYAWEVANDPKRSSIAGKVGVTSLPHFQNGDSVSALGGWLYGISAYSEHPEEAWTFIQFLSSYGMQKYFALRAGIAPSRTALFNDRELVEVHPFFRDQFAVFQGTSPRPRSPLYPAVSHVLQRYFSRALAFADLDLAAEAASADRQILDLLALTEAMP